MMHQPIHPGVGFEVKVAPGDRVARGDSLGVVHAKDEAGARLGAEALRVAVRIGDAGEPIVCRPLVGRRVE
jgi:thymidine phosphorylase